VYQWARRLAGEHYGWWTGWAYIWCLVIAVAGGGYFVAMFLPLVLNIAPFEASTQILVAIGVVLVVTLLNASGPKVLKFFAGASLIVELIGSVGLGIVLLVAHRNQPLSVIFDSFGTGAGSGGYLWAGLLAAMGFVGWAFVGFESAGAIAEEVKDARRNVPKAMIASLIAIGVVVLFSGLALILAIPDMNAAVSGESIDPAADAIIGALGVNITQPLFGLIVIGFLASMMAAQTSASRVIWSFSRDGVLPASGTLSKLSKRHQYPVNAIFAAFLVSVVVLVVALFSAQVYSTLVAFSTAGFFIAFALPIIALLVARMRGKWIPGPVTLGRWAGPIVVIAAAWTIFETINIIWPRNPQFEWYQNYSVPLALLVVAILGVLTWIPLRRKIAAAEHVLESRNDE
jgi:amino acid transporter